MGENPSSGTKAESLIARATPRHDQCGKPGHGVVYLTARAEVDAALMSVSADCDYIDAAMDLTLDEARDLAASLLAAVDSVEAGSQRQGVRNRPRLRGLGGGTNTFAFGYLVGFGVAAALACLTVWWATR